MSDKKSEHHSFIHDWIDNKQVDGERKQAIMDAIQDSLGGVRNEELDDAKLLKMLIAIKAREGSND